MDAMETCLHGKRDTLAPTLSPHEDLAGLSEACRQVVVVGGSYLHKPTNHEECSRQQLFCKSQHSLSVYVIQPPTHHTQTQLFIMATKNL